MHLALFDFDKTIINKDTGFYFIRFSLEKRRLRLFLAFLLSPVAMPFMLFEKTKIFGNSVFLWCATCGLSKRETVMLRQSFILDYMASKDTCIYKDALATINTHLAKGDRVLIVSGASQWMIRKILIIIGIQNVAVIGSQETRLIGGMVGTFHCIATNKVARIARCLDLRLYPTIIGYSDSATDIPMLSLCTRKVIINPTKSSLKKFVKIFGSNISVEHWR